MRFALAVTLSVSASICFASEKYEYFDAPVKLKHFKANAEGMVSEGFNVTDKNDKYTLACRVKNGTPVFIRDSDGFVAEMNKKPAQYLRDPRGSTHVSLQWAEICRRLIK